MRLLWRSVAELSRSTNTCDLPTQPVELVDVWRSALDDRSDGRRFPVLSGVLEQTGWKITNVPAQDPALGHLSLCQFVGDFLGAYQTRESRPIPR